MDLPVFLLYILLPLVAFLYASVGHGGASGYLALMALFSFAPEIMRPTALVLNMLVSCIAFYQYRKAAPLPIKLFLALIVGSVPMAFWGGSLSIDPKIYRTILGVFLLFPSIRLFGFFEIKEKELIPYHPLLALFLGSGIGFLSGLIGIGGGIILSPILLMLGWSGFKTTATVSALFIAVNSVAGMAGGKLLEISFHPNLIAFLTLAFAGGVLGAYLGAKRFNLKMLRLLLGVVLLMASLKLVFV